SGNPSNTTLARMVVGALGLAVVLTIVLIVDVRRQGSTSGQNVVELRRQNADLIRANNELQSQLSGRATELADERTQSKAILQSMSEGVIVLDAERIRYANRALSRLTGFSVHDLTSKPLDASDALPLAGQFSHLREIVAAAIAQGGIWQ